jgi:hypothetical protein
MEHDMSDCGCYLCNGVTQHEQDFKYVCDTCKEEGLKYTQQDLANKTGLKQPHIGGHCTLGSNEFLSDKIHFLETLQYN